MRLTCPHCGPRDQAEFTYLGDASVRRPSDTGDADAVFEYVYLRDNPPGEHQEYWYHGHGCRAWLVVRRHVTTHAILDVRSALPTGMASA